MLRELPDMTLVRSGGNVVSCNVSGGEVLLNLQQNVYFSLNTVGSFVWRNICGEATSVRDLETRVVKTFDVTDSVCRADLQALLFDMKDAGLVEFDDAPAS